MGVGNQVHASMEVYSKHTRQSATQKLKSTTYFDWSGVRFGRVGGAGSAGPEVAAVAAAVLDAAVLDAAAGPRAAVAAAVGLPAVAAGISAAAAAE